MTNELDIRKKLSSSLKVFGPFGAVTGFIGDVITPLGEYLNWVSIGLVIATVVTFLLWLVAKSNASIEKITKYLPQLSILTVVFGFFSLIGINSEKGYFADNFESVSNLQSSLFNIEQGINRVENKVDKISGQISEIKDLVKTDLASIDDRIGEIENKIANGLKVNSPKSLEDYLVNASISYNNSDFKECERMLENVFREGYFKYDLVYKYLDVLFNNYNGDEDRINAVLKKNKLDSNILFDAAKIDYNLAGVNYYIQLDKLNITDPLLKAYLINNKAKSLIIDAQNYGFDMMGIINHWSMIMSANESILGKRIIKSKPLFFDYTNTYKKYLTTTSHSGDENAVWQFYDPSKKADVVKSDLENLKKESKTQWLNVRNRQK